VAHAFVGSRRRENLSFSHHAAVAALSPEEQDRLLDWAEEGIAINGRPRPRYELRAKVAEFKRTEDLEEQPLPRGPGNTISEEQYRRFIAKTRADFSPRSNPAISELDDDLEEPQPSLKLDDSPASLPVPPSLAALTLEPPPLDRVAIAAAALGAMDIAEIREVLIRLPDRCIAAIKAVVAELPSRRREEK
jgi:hypothetical protein